MSTSSQIEPTPPPAGSGDSQGTQSPLKWHQRILGLCFAIFALELGIFLFVFPWLRVWGVNWLPMQSPGLRALWISPYFRGALSGVGLVNLYVGVAELGRQLRSLLG
ncbi:MAG: hypothetical protein WAM39_16440 [Bryobacteraceae bacterium]